MALVDVPLPSARIDGSDINRIVALGHFPIVYRQRRIFSNGCTEPKRQDGHVYLLMR